MIRNRKAAVAAVVLIPVLAGGFLLQERAVRDSGRLFDQVLTLINSRFVDSVGAAELYERAARGLVAELNDPYSELFTPEDLKSFTTQTGGRYAGIGMQIEQQENHVAVSRVFPNTPAEEASVREGDRIVAIDTTGRAGSWIDTRGWTTSKVSDALLGKPGTKVSVRFARPGAEEPIEIRFTRAVVHIPAVPYALMLDDRVGYVPLQRFSENAAAEVARAVTALRNQGARSLVLDVRGNPGGILEQSIDLSGLFLPRGTEVASVRGRGAPAQHYRTERGPAIPAEMPVVVLTDGYSASASEIVAGALQDHDRALVVGTTTFGKGLVQTLYPLDGGYALKITTGKWYTPSGRSIQKERKIVDGQFVEEEPDSLETDLVKKDRPAYRSRMGRVVYGGGGVTPDVITAEDTLTTIEQQVAKALFGGAKAQTAYTILSDYALELKPSVKADFVVNPAWRAELLTRLEKGGIAVDRAQYGQAGAYIDALLDQRVARLAFGDSTAKRRRVGKDAPLRRAMEILRQGQRQSDLFTIAKSYQSVADGARPGQSN